MLIENDHWVTVRYRLFDSEGQPIEDGERELTYLQGGYGSVFPRIEETLAGHEAGYTTSLYLQPEDSFGDYDAELVRLAPREEFPEELEIGMTFEGSQDEEPDDDDPERLWVVTDFTGEVVVLDGNHPLAGMALRFDMEVVGVRAATPEEIERERARAAGELPDEDDESDDDDEDTVLGVEGLQQVGRTPPRTLH